MTDIAAQPVLINGRGRIPSWKVEGGEECDSVTFAEDPEGVFQQQLINIDEEMGLDDLHALKFLCVDYIPVSKLENSKSPLDVFTHMRKGMLINIENVDFLLECLGRIHRFDLVKKLGFDPDDIRANIGNLNKVTPYRRLLMDLAEDMDDKDLQRMKFLLSGQIKKNKLNQANTILDLFVVMEQDQITSADKPEGLAEIMASISRPDLVTIVNVFTGVDQARPDPVCTRAPILPNQPAEYPPMARQTGNNLGNPLRQRELTVCSGSSSAERRPPVDRSASAGTLVLSESENSSYEDAAEGGGDYLPQELLIQIAEEAKNQFNDLGIELGFTNDDIEEFNDQCIVALEKTERLLKTWQARKVDKGQIGTGLHYALGKLGLKTAAAAVMQWMQSLYQGNQSQSPREGRHAAGAQSQVPVEPARREPARQGFDINYTSSTNEARPLNFPQPSMPVASGPPQNGYQPPAQSENVAISLREARPLREPEPVDPQIQERNVQQIEERMRSVYLSGQLQPQQMVNQFTRVVGEMTSQNQPQVALPNQAPVAPVPSNQPPVVRADLAPASNVEQDLPSLPEYKMSRHPRGWCVIINNKEFKVDTRDKDAKEMPPRIGTDKDAESLQAVFSKLGFTVRRRDNLADHEIMHYLVDVSHNVDHSLFDCLVICILTHGIENYVYGSNGKLVSIKDMTSVFQSNRCPNLAGKPKLFFLQSCQGRNKMEGNEIERDAAPNYPRSGGHGGHRSNVEIDGGKEMIPNEADFLIGYATVPGYVSFRSRNNGSWYIRKLCELLEKYSSRHDLLSILVEVNREVSHANAQLDGGVFKQTPAPLVTLRKKLYFR